MSHFPWTRIIETVELQIIATLMGSALENFKKAIPWLFCRVGTKYRRIAKYVVLGKIQEESASEFIRRVIDFASNLFIIDIFLILQYAICASTLFWLKIQQNGLSDWNHILVEGIFVGELFLFVIVTQIRFKSIRIKLYSIAWMLIIYASTLFGILVRNEMVLHLMYIVVPWTETVLIILFFEKTIWSNQYRDKRIYLIKVIELVMLLVMGSEVSFEQLRDNQHIFDVIFFAFFALCVLEGILKKMKDDKCVVDVVISFREGEEKVREPITYCVDNRVMYITQNGICKFADMDDINYISYRLEKNWIKYKRNGKCAFCKLIDGEKFFFQTFRCEKKDWITFENYEDRKREVYLYPVKKYPSLGTHS